MILLTDYINYWESVKERIPQIKIMEVVTNESEMQNIIKDIASEEMILIAVIPSAQNVGDDCDDINEESVVLLYLVEKLNLDDYTRSEFLSRLASSQLLMRQMKLLMLDDKANCNNTNIMRYMQTRGWNEDPEYNLLGCYGWSLSLRANVFGV